MIPDALMTLFDMSGLARLFYRGAQVTSRTYNVEADGATYGCLIPGLNSFQGVSRGERVELVVSAGEGFRTNLAIVNTAEPNAPGWALGTIEIYDQAGALIGSRPFGLFQRVGTQFNDILAPSGGVAHRAARIVVHVENTSAGVGPIAAYATVVDNASNDITYYAGQLGATN